ncbi:unnamed protein product [Blepharisma stoltei]|uniref:SRCR domain-containing protein n=1 Tax=Blepharisma stoltei TaxID=1481888 RepID=A0AAU9IYK7_9CILI|nr:unnamed protein product [Blepharisma stoltei]
MHFRIFWVYLSNHISRFGRKPDKYFDIFFFSCDSGCSICLSSSNCISTCSNPQYPDNCSSQCTCPNSAVASCSNSNLSVCTICDSSCSRTCSGPASNQCIDIVSTYCGGYPYSYVQKKCLWGVTCPSNCYYCETSSICITCKSGYFVSSGSCPQCDSSCKTCSGISTNCLSCPTSGVTPSSSGKCQCASSEYQISSSPLTCGTCDSSCSTCSGSGSNNCLTCANSAITIASPPGSCSCGTSQYMITQSPLTCGSCDSSCSTCSGSGSSKCLTCANSAITIASPPGSCSCGVSQYMASQSPLTCGNCDSSCSTCSGSGASNCLTCVNSAITISSPPGSCSCGTSQYMISQSPLTCGNCDSSCKTCNGSGTSNCLTCANSAITIASPPGSCSCGTSQYMISQSPLTCGNCDSSCKTCNGSGTNNCWTCANSAITISSPPGSCSCGTSQYMISQSPLTCGNCDSSCSTCNGSGANNCLTCANSAITIASPPGSCSCGTSQYMISQSPLTCGNCDSSCSTCSGSGANNCLTCANSAITISSPPGSCSCGTSQYTISQSPLTCGNCDSNCSTCNGSGTNNCLTCANSAITIASPPGSCSCGASQYMISQSPLSCGNCDSSCSTCSGSGANNCLTCANSAITIASPPGSCSCGTSQYMISQSPLTCGNCDSSCSTCSSSGTNNCLTCANSAIAISSPPGSCSCGTSQYMISQSPLTCGNCDSSCSTCNGSGANNCLTCANSSIILSATPSSCSCNSNEYMSSLNPKACSSCYSLCATCSGGSSGDCLTCASSSIILSVTPSSCNCNSNEYMSSLNPKTCSSCDTSCGTCSGGSSTDCLTCANSSIVLSSTPSSCTCNSNEYMSALSPKTCSSCHSSCATCSGGSSADCLTCTDSSVTPATSPGSCTCASNQYKSSSSPLACTNCDSSCSTCAGSTISSCYTCTDSSITPATSPGACSCLSSQYIITSNPLSCGSCDSSCLTCNGSSSNDCLTCSNTSIVLSVTPSSCSCNSNEYMSSLNPKTCSSCYSTCATCSGGSSSDCLTCVDTSITLAASPGSCTCASNQYKTANSPLSCSNCHSSCSTCTGSSISDCYTCSYSSITPATSPGSCSCLSNQYIITSSPLSCGNCDSSCGTCSGLSSNDCLACPNSSIVLSPTPNSCTCNSNEYMSALNPKTCNSCHSSCATCSGGSPADCLTCTDTSITLATSPRSCTCASNQYKSSSSPLTCINCDSSCSTCSGYGPSQCLTCANSAITPSTTPGYCKCNTSEYIKTYSPLSCGACDSSCHDCAGGSSNDCITCSNSEITLSKTPSSCFCGSSQYTISTSPLSCGNCHSSCATCTGPNKTQCLTCSNSSITLANPPESCSCDASQYLISSSPLSCGNCYADCYTCIGSNPNQCTSCTNSLLTPSSSPGFCSCQTSEYILSNSPLECGPCHESCKTCSGPNSGNCLTCNNSSITLATTPGSCTCGESQYFVSKSPLACGDCHEDCLTCTGSGSNQCLSCKNTTITPSLDGHCKCKYNEYIISLSSLECGSCDTSCMACIGPSADQCLTCKDSSINLATQPSICSSGDKNSTQNGDALNTLAKNSGGYVSSGLIIAGFAKSVITGRTGTLWTYVNIVQLLAFIPLQNIVIPESLYHFWKAFLSYTILPNFGKILYGEDGVDESQLSTHWYKYGYKGSSFLVNGGGMLFIAFIVFFLWAIVYSLTFYPNEKLQNKMKVILGKFKYNAFIRLWLEIYILLITATIIGINNLLFESYGAAIDSLLSLFSFILNVFVTIILLSILFLYRFKIYRKSRKITAKYGSLFEEFKSCKSYVEILYYPFFLFRRFIFALNLYNSSGSPIVQWLINLLHSSLTVLFLIKYWHFKDKDNHFLNVSGEMLVAVSFLLTGPYIYDISYTMNYGIQVAVIGLTFLYLVTSYYFLIAKICSSIKAKFEKKKNAVAPESVGINENASEVNETSLRRQPIYLSNPMFNSSETIITDKVNEKNLI